MSTSDVRPPALPSPSLPSPSVSRRHFLGAAATGAGLLGMPRPLAAQGEFTEWGWPLPYVQVSAKSIEWLKAKGMWPFLVGAQSPYPPFAVMRDLKLLGLRGLENRVEFFNAGPPLNEALIAGRVHSGVAGDFPFIGLVGRELPVVAIASPQPVNTQAFLVPKDSPLRSLKDLAGRSTPAVMGLVVGSSSEFLFASAAKVHGIQIGKDVIVKNLSPAEIVGMPKGVDLTSIWSPFPDIMVSKGTARVLEYAFPYAFVHNYTYVMRELVENVPDVVQALADAILEGTLFARSAPAQVAEMMSRNPGYDVYERWILERIVFLNSTVYKPTHLLLFPEFWSRVAEIGAGWLRSGRRLTRTLTADQLKKHDAPEFMERAVQRAGFKVPSQPPWLPASWDGNLDKPPYPTYHHSGNLSAPQPFPEKGDLVKPWKFKGQTYTP